MDKLQLKQTIDKLAKFVNADKDNKVKLYSKCSNMSEIEAIVELSEIAYVLLENNVELFYDALTVIRDINPEICPPVEKMRDALIRKFLNEVEGNMSLEENHKLINDVLIKCTTLFNEYGIDYYIVGALPCFIKTGQKMFRYHDDIDIMVNEEDIYKISEIMNLMGYKFYDDRFPNVQRFNEMKKNKPPHTVLAQNPDNEFHLGFFTFKRKKDGSITMREYSHRMEGNTVIVDLLERNSTPEGTRLRYDENPTVYLGTCFKTCSIESVYKLKQFTRRPKDIIDMKRLELFVDANKLKKLNEIAGVNEEHKNIKVL